MSQNAINKVKVYPTREERMRKAAKKATATKQSAHEFLVAAGILDHEGKLAAHLR